MHLLNNAAHRPWPVPSNNWIMRQKWRNFLFMHWPVNPELVSNLIPSPLRLDTFQGYAWLGYIAFLMDGIYPRALPKLPLTRRFPEINVRTYVQYDGKPGIFFLSIDVKNWASLKIARHWYHLPYHSSNVSIEHKGTTFSFQSIRNENNRHISFKALYKPISDVFSPEEGTLDHWLTERYCLYSRDKTSNIYCGEIHHLPWPLQKAEFEIQSNSLLSPFNINLRNTNPIAHYSGGVDALIWNIRKVHSR